MQDPMAKSGSDSQSNDRWPGGLFCGYAGGSSGRALAGAPCNTYARSSEQGDAYLAMQHVPFREELYIILLACYSPERAPVSGCKKGCSHKR